MPPIKHRIAKRTMGEREIGTVELAISENFERFRKIESELGYRQKIRQLCSFCERYLGIRKYNELSAMRFR